MIFFLFPIFVFFLIASAFSVNKIILNSIAPYLFVSLRMGISGLLLILIFCRKKNLWLKAKENIKSLILISSFTTLIPSILRAFALKNISSSRASFWGAFEPFITSIYMYLLFNQKLTKNKLIGCFLGFFGALFFIFTNKNISGLSITFFCLADFLQIMSIILSRYGWINAQKILNEKKIFTPEQLNGFTFTISAFISIILSFMYEKNNIFNLLITKKLIFCMLYTILIGNMLAYTLYGYLLKKYEATFVSLAGLSVPLFVHLIGPVLLNEKISFYFFISMGFIFLALYSFNKK